MRKLSKKITYLLLAVSAIFLPWSAFASTLYMETNHSNFFVGDTIMFNVRVDSESKNINAVEGEVLLDYPSDVVSLVDLNTSGSKFTLWPRRPLPSGVNNSISFAGGIPRGLDSRDAIIFKIILKLQKEGQIKLTPSNAGVYLNDGQGTKDETRVKGLVINVLPSKPDSQPIDDWGNLTSKDKMPPESFEILLGQDKSVFEGKKFLSFYTTDDQSGVDYYEVQEGNLPPVRSGETYVLKNQKNNGKVIVTAFDAARNSRKSVYDPVSPGISSNIWPIYLTLGLLVLALMIIFIKRKNVFVGK